MCRYVVFVGSCGSNPWYLEILGTPHGPKLQDQRLLVHHPAWLHLLLLEAQAVGLGSILGMLQGVRRNVHLTLLPLPGFEHVGDRLPTTEQEGATLVRARWLTDLRGAESIQ